MISDATLLSWTKSDAADTATLRLLEQAAVKACEQITGRYLGVTAAISEDINFRDWPLTLSSDPIGGTLNSLSQWDGSAWAAVDAADYYVDGSFVWPTQTFTYPTNALYGTTSKRFRAVYQAGYTVDAGDANVWDAPKDIQAAVLLLVGHWNENRESVVTGTIASEVPMSVQMILAPHTRVSV